MAAHHQSARAWGSRASRQRSLNRAGASAMRQEGRRPVVTVIIGTSGWQYRDWRGRFYPQKLPQRLWLEHFAAHFATVESNNAFYRLSENATVGKRPRPPPPDFRGAVKPSRFLTRIKRLREPEEPVARLMGRAEGLERRLDTILLQ